jgi:hypothetical protein
MNPASEQPADPQQALTNMASSNSHQPAANAVLNTYELLCDILLRLPLEDLVVATGVCGTWRKLKDNLAFQQALFLAPVEIRDITFQRPCVSQRLEDLALDEDWYYSIVSDLHPSVTRICAQTLGSREHRCSMGILASTPVRKPRSKHSSGSWRDMFIT